MKKVMESMSSHAGTHINNGSAWDFCLQMAVCYIRSRKYSDRPIITDTARWLVMSLLYLEIVAGTLCASQMAGLYGAAWVSFWRLYLYQ